MEDRPPIQAKAIGVFRRQAQVLVAYATDPVKRERYARPPGGTVEFGERSIDGLRREIREELGVELGTARLLGILEDLFEIEGRPRHEIVFVFAAEFSDPSCYDCATLPLQEAGWDGPATWAPLDEFRSGQTPLYPSGLLSLIEAQPSAEHVGR